MAGGLLQGESTPMTLQICTFEGDAVDAPGLRQALGRFATGVAVIATRTPEGKLEGLTANSFAAVSLDPPLVLWSLRRNAPSLPSFQRAGSFAVNVLSAGQRELSRHFATPSADKFSAVPHALGRGRLPADRRVPRLARVPHRLDGRWWRSSDFHRSRSARQLRRRRAADLQRRAILPHGGVGLGGAASSTRHPGRDVASRSGICRNMLPEVPDSLARPVGRGSASGMTGIRRP